ncbi:Regulator of nonsense transcripts upf2 [Orobanche gracilis]
MRIFERDGPTSEIRNNLSKISKIYLNNFEKTIRDLHKTNFTSFIDEAINNIREPEFEKKDIIVVVKLVAGLMAGAFFANEHNSHKAMHKVLNLKTSRKRSSMYLLIELFYNGIFKDDVNILTIVGNLLYIRELSDEDSQLTSNLHLQKILAKALEKEPPAELADCNPILLQKVYTTKEKTTKEKPKTKKEPREPLECLQSLQKSVKRLVKCAQRSAPTSEAQRDSSSAQPTKGNFMNTLMMLSKSSDRFVIDFHFLTLQHALNFLRFNLIFLGVQGNIKKFVIITGKGGGTHGDPKIKLRIKYYAKQHNLEIKEGPYNDRQLIIEVDENLRKFEIKKEEEL